MSARTQTRNTLKALALPSLLVSVAAGGAHLLNRFQEAQIFAPLRFPHGGVWDPAAADLAVEDVFFQSEDDVRLHAWWIERKRSRGTVLYCHGNNGNISTRIDALVQLGRLGLNVFAFDYRGYGRSEGEPSEQGLYRDVRAAYDHLCGPLGQPSTRILLLGHSLGGAVAIDLALHRPIAGLVVQSSFTQIRDMARNLAPWGPLGWLTSNQFRSIEKVPEIEVPKLFLHGGDDPTVPVEMGRRLYEAAREEKDWYEIDRAGHNDLHLQGGMRYFWLLYRFSRRCLS
jgi:fermentation-respiration switch protein FrsA (DUF1100 family)